MKNLIKKAKLFIQTYVKHMRVNTKQNLKPIACNAIHAGDNGYIIEQVRLSPFASQMACRMFSDFLTSKLVRNLKTYVQPLSHLIG